MNQWLKARRLIDEASRIVVLTGAGISTDSGIPDFRGPNGVWTKNPEAVKTATLQHYLSDPDIRRQSWQHRLTSPAWTALPNDGHRALVELERRDKLLALVTQNVDELHQQAGSDPSLVLEVHGTQHWVQCWSCGERAPMRVALDRVRAGEDDPPCRTCGGILKSATISFGQDLDPVVLGRARDAVESCDLLLAVGTSLTVYPAAGLVPLARSAGGHIVIVNAEATPYDELAEVVITDPISEVLPAICRGE